MKTLLFLMLFTPLYSEEISSPILITKDNTVLSDKYLKLSRGANCPMIVVGDSLNEEPGYRVSHVLLKNLYLDGNKDFQTSEYYNEGFLRNNCITVRAGSSVTIQNVVVCYARSGGIVLEKKCENIIIDGLNAYNCFFDGFAMCESTGCTLMNGTLHRNDYAGISMDWRCNKNKFFNLDLDYNQDVGIFMRDSNENIFFNIGFKGSGIYLNKRDFKNTGCSDNLFLEVSDIPIYVGDECWNNKLKKRGVGN